MFRLRRYLGNQFFRLVFFLAGLREQKARPAAWHLDCDRQRDEATAEWLHNLDVKTRTEILMRAVDSKQAETDGGAK